MSESPHRGEPLVRRLLGAWPVGWAFVLLLTLGAGALALEVKPDFGVELLFPTSDPARRDYDRFKEHFPFEDAHALVLVEADDLYSPAGLARVSSLETALRDLEGVRNTDSLVSLQDVVDDEGELTVQVLFPSLPEPPGAAELAAGQARATGDPLFAWRLANPAGDATTLRVTLTQDYARDDTQRRSFMAAARAVLAQHRSPAQRLTLTGMPVLRAQYTEMIQADTGVLVPVAFGLVIVLIFVAFPRRGHVLAAVATLGLSVLWAYGAMGLCGFPLHPLTNVTPIVVLIISVSDTVHILAHHRDYLSAGRAPRDAIAAATAESAIPCLLTELAIAGGFLGLLGADMLMIQQFGVATALGVLLAWLANMTALPLCLLAFGPRALPAAGGPGRAASALQRFVGWVEGQVVERPRRVLAVAALITAAALAAGANVGREYYNFDDLREGSPIRAELAAATRLHGGVVPLAILLEPSGELAELPPPGEGLEPEPMIDPRVIALSEQIEERLERLPEVHNAISPASVLRKAHRILLGEEETRAEPLPTTRAAVAQELLLVDDGDLFADTLTVNRGAACVLATMPDTGSTRAREVIAQLERDLAELTQGLPVRATITGNYVIADAVYRSLVGGLVRSLGVAVLVTFLIFALVLRSWRLALIGLVPNLLPLALTLGVMSLLGIDLKVSTVIVFSITLVVADDDTIQYLSRFRRRLDQLLAQGHPEPVSAAALEVLRGTGAPMLVTTLAISLGFVTLLASSFLGVAHLGLLIGVSLFTAVFADLFLSPLLLRGLSGWVAKGPGAPRAAGADPSEG